MATQTKFELGDLITWRTVGVNPRDSFDTDTCWGEDKVAIVGQTILPADVPSNAKLVESSNQLKELLNLK